MGITSWNLLFADHKPAVFWSIVDAKSTTGTITALLAFQKPWILIGTVMSSHEGKTLGMVFTIGYHCLRVPSVYVNIRGWFLTPSPGLTTQYILCIKGSGAIFRYKWLKQAACREIIVATVGTNIQNIRYIYIYIYIHTHTYIYIYIQLW